MLRNYYYVNYYYIVLQYLRLSDHTGERRAPFNVTPHHKLLDDFLTIRPYFSFLDRLGLNKVFKCPSKLNLKYHGLPRRVFLAMPFTRSSAWKTRRRSSLKSCACQLFRKLADFSENHFFRKLGNSFTRSSLPRPRKFGE